MTTTLEQHDWTVEPARRTNSMQAGDITAILAEAGATGIITFSGGFPDPGFLPQDKLAAISSRVISADPGIALQYSATQGLAGTRDFLISRLAEQHGRAPAEDELLVTSGGIDCMELLAKSYLNPGDDVCVEAPTYLGAITAFSGYEAALHSIAIDDEGMRVDQLSDRLSQGLRPKFLYTIPDYQNPTGYSMSLPRREALIALARRYGFLIVEDVAYRDLSFAERPPRSLWSLAPDVVLQAGTFSKVFTPGFRLGWAAGPPAVIRWLTVAKQNSDQCAGAFGQRMLEEYGRTGELDKFIATARPRYARRAELMAEALTRHMPDGSTWTTPAGGFYIWLTVPGADTVALASRARAENVAYVPGQPFYVSPDKGTDQIRLSFSRVADHLIDEGIKRIGVVLASAAEE